jgi:hypothetical protein
VRAWSGARHAAWSVSSARSQVASSLDWKPARVDQLRNGGKLAGKPQVNQDQLEKYTGNLHGSQIEQSPREMDLQRLGGSGCERGPVTRDDGAWRIPARMSG